MKLTNTQLALALIATATAQTPSNFSVVSTSPLEVIGEPGNITIAPGVLLPQRDVLDVPSVFVNSSAPAGNYVVFMIDPTTDMGTFLHWFQPNLVADSNGNLTVDVTTQNASTAVGASYIYPQPPAENFAHLYVILLYQQPPNWAVPSNYSTINPPSDITARLGFDIADFQRASGLSDPIGTNFFRVLNGTAEQTSTIATATPTFTAASSSGSGATTASATSTTESATSTASGNAAAMNGGGTMSMATWAGIFGLPLFLF